MSPSHLRNGPYRGRAIVMAVTDARRLSLSDADLAARIGWLAAAGVDWIQIRERDRDDRTLVAIVRDALRAVRGTAARILVNDRSDIAVAAGADGVHLREDSVAAPRVRALAGAARLVGRSVHSPEAAEATESTGGCDYLLFGTVFPSAGKDRGHRTAGEAGLREVCRDRRLPVIAIGGIDEARAARVAAAGAAGVAAVGTLLSVRDDREAVARVAALRHAFDSGSAVV